MTLWIARFSPSNACWVFPSRPEWRVWRWEGPPCLFSLTIKAVEDLTGIALVPNQLISVEMSCKLLTETMPQVSARMTPKIENP